MDRLLREKLEQDGAWCGFSFETIILSDPLTAKLVYGNPTPSVPLPLETALTIRGRNRESLSSLCPPLPAFSSFSEV